MSNAPMARENQSHHLESHERALLEALVIAPEDGITLSMLEEIMPCRKSELVLAMTRLGQAGLVCLGNKGYSVCNQDLARQIESEMALARKYSLSQAWAALFQRQLAAQTKTIHRVLDHLPDGLIEVDESGKLTTLHSRATRTLLGVDEFETCTLQELLFAHGDLGDDAVSKAHAALSFCFGQPEFMARLNWEHLPGALTYTPDTDQSSRQLELTWAPVMNEWGDVERVMVLLRDETGRRATQTRSIKLERVIELLSAGVRHVQEFSFNARQRLNENHLLIDEELLRDDRTLATLFRNMHTIKGNARLLGLTQLSEAAHHAEEPIAALRQIPPEERDESCLEHAAEAIEHELHGFIDALHVYEETLTEYFGELLGDQHAIDSHVLERVRGHAEHGYHNPSHAHDAIASIHALLTRADATSLKHIVKKTARMFATLSTELEKPAPEICLTGQSLWMTFSFGGALHDAMIHLFRNAFDHGIESPEARRQEHKPEAGQIVLHVQLDDHGATLDIMDDGAGLDLRKLRELADAPHLDDDEAARLVFDSGRTTSTEVSSVSGRGVGMDAVHHFLNTQGCTIQVMWREPCANARGRRRFAWRLRIPCTHLIDMQAGLAQPFEH